MASIENSFQYLVWNPLYETEKPFQIFSDIPPHSPDQRKDNLHFAPTSNFETINDVRGKENLYIIDKHGFQFIKHPSCLSDSELLDKNKLRKSYIPECELLIQKTLDDVDEVVVFDWRVRFAYPFDEYELGS